MVIAESVVGLQFVLIYLGPKANLTSLGIPTLDLNISVPLDKSLNHHVEVVMSILQMKAPPPIVMSDVTVTAPLLPQMHRLLNTNLSQISVFRFDLTFNLR